VSTPHVLLVVLGPVQEFIAQARRTRDLWYGSHLLSEMSKAAARALAPRGCLVFPALDTGSRDLEPCEEPIGADGSLPLNVANHVLVVLDATQDPRAAAQAARQAAQQRLLTTAERVRARRASILAPDAAAAWDEQIATHTEFVACWRPILAGNYKAALEAVEGDLAARKGLREFHQWDTQREGVPKSSLDGARETVLRRFEADREPADWRTLRISRGEQLDAIGLVKRAGGEPEQFVPIANIALAAWIEEASRRAAGPLDALRSACKQAHVPQTRRDLRWVARFPFDAHVLQPARWEALAQECGLAIDDTWGRTHVEPLLAAMPQPFPYVAALVADGDHMGRTLSQIEDPEQHRQFSARLAEFAGQARAIVEGPDVRGILIYAGGDDVLAFVTLPDALACAARLRAAFETCVSSALATIPGTDVPTLSVGLGIGHLMDEMGHLLAVGREAERLAKTGGPRAEHRNALAIVVDKRSGPRAAWRSRWRGATLGDPIARLHADIALFASGRLGAGKLFEVRAMLRRMPQPREVGEQESQHWAHLLLQDTLRTLSRAERQHDAGRLVAADVGLHVGEHAPYQDVHAAIDAWVERLRVARTFASAEVATRAAVPGEVLA
jgi:CRISPR-associated protein Cmr2